MSNQMVTFELKGDFKKTHGFFERCLEIFKLGYLDKYGQRGVDALSANTPKDTGLLSSSWTYEIVHKGSSARIVWHNTDIENGYNVAILIQYGHATKDGAFVEGIDFINPALQPIFEEIAEDAWREVTNL